MLDILYRKYVLNKQELEHLYWSYFAYIKEARLWQLPRVVYSIKTFFFLLYLSIKEIQRSEGKHMDVDNKDMC